jgi:hypothetical protein
VDKKIEAVILCCLGSKEANKAILLIQSTV